MAQVTYTFTAGTKAQASQVNKNFDDCITGINQNASSITTINGNITTLTNGKANKNGSTTEIFNVANPTTGYNAVNKSYLESWTSPIKDYINGLIISKVSGSTTQVAVSTGSCQDSTHTVVISLTSGQTIEYASSLSASTTYDVFIRQSKSDSTVDCVILAHNAEPSTTDYYYRKLGEVTTNDDSEIAGTTSYSSSLDKVGYPDLTAGVSKTSGTVECNGWLKVNITGQQCTGYLYVNGIEVAHFYHDDDENRGASWSGMIPVAKGSTVSVSTTKTGYTPSVTFYPCL